MPDTATFGLFAAASLALLVVPGPTVFYVVARSIEGGRRAGLASVAGAHLGTFVHIAAAAVGVSAIVVSSATAYSVLKYAGAAYLVFLGIRRLRERRALETPAVTPARTVPIRTLVAQGALVNVLNPKTALFFLAFLPQFVDADGGHVALQVVALGIVFVSLGVVSDSLYAIAGGAVAANLRRSRRARRAERYVSASVYVGLGVGAALGERSAPGALAAGR